MSVWSADWGHGEGPGCSAPTEASERAGAGTEQGRWSDRWSLGREGPHGSVVATVLLYVLNGYMSIEARMTSTGEGKMSVLHTVGIDISKDWLDA